MDVRFELESLSALRRNAHDEANGILCEGIFRITRSVTDILQLHAALKSKHTNLQSLRTLHDDFRKNEEPQLGTKKQQEQTKGPSCMESLVGLASLQTGASWLMRIGSCERPGYLAAALVPWLTVAAPRSMAITDSRAMSIGFRLLTGMSDSACSGICNSLSPEYAARCARSCKPGSLGRLQGTESNSTETSA